MRWLSLIAAVLVFGAVFICRPDALRTPLPVPGEARADSAAPSPSDKIPTCGVDVVRMFPHDSRAFTQGLLYLDGFFYESTGLYGKSGIRRVEPETGRVVQQYDMPARYFGEGLCDWKDTLVQLTWRAGKGFVYDRESFAVKREFAYRGEGWGIASDGKNLIMSNGSSTLAVLNPQTFAKEREIEVTSGGLPVMFLNELEYIHGEIFANIWQKDTVARISPQTGRVTGWIDMSVLRGYLPAGSRAEALNGIAYDARGDRMFVTGKWWPLLFEIKITCPKSSGKHQ